MSGVGPGTEAVAALAAGGLAWLLTRWAGSLVGRRGGAPAAPGGGTLAAALSATIAAAGVFARAGMGPLGLDLAWLMAASCAAAAVDQHSRRIPNALSAAAFVGAAALAVWAPAAPRLWLAAGAALLLAIAVLLSRLAGLGMGDAKWLAVLGAGLGPIGGLLVLALASALAGAVGAVRAIAGRGGWRERYAFAPYLAVALAVVAVCLPGTVEPLLR